MDIAVPRHYQIELAGEAADMLSNYGMSYLSMEERTGKSLIGLLAMEQHLSANNVLIITKKNAMEGWTKTLKECPWLTKKYEVINYHSATKCTGTHDAMILDESHNDISGFPKPGKIWRDVRRLCKGFPVIFMSATPYAQGMHLLFHQLAVSDNRPWDPSHSFYDWYRMYAKRNKSGNTKTVRVNGRDLETYNHVDHDKVLRVVDHLFISRTREQLGFVHEPKDILHYVKLSKKTRHIYNELLRNKLFVWGEGDNSIKLIADTPMKLLTSLHMLEGGVFKTLDGYFCLDSKEKANYIRSKWGDNDNLAIMYHYVAEGIKLRQIFKKAQIFQGTRFSEGVDLFHIEHMVIYSQDFSTARHTQRRARQTNKNRLNPINVHYLLVKKGISDQVYKTVSSNKKNFVDSRFSRQAL